MSEFDKHAGGYAEMMERSLAPIGGFDEYYTRRKVEHVAAAVSGSRVASLVDFGCGIGSTIGLLRAAFPEARIAGTDVSAGSLAEAARRHPGEAFHVLDESFARSHERAFDVAYVANVFHHVPPASRIAVMRQVSGLLAPGGRLFFFEHNPYNPLTRWVVSRCEFDEDAILLAPREARELARGAGLDCGALRYLLFFPPRLAALARAEAALGWLPAGAQYCLEARKPATA